MIAQMGGGMIAELGSDLIPVLAISLSFLFGSIWLVLATIDSLYKTARNSALKEKLIARGASASEIEQIVNAGHAWGREYPTNQPQPPVKHQARQHA